jgi:hypothetical protein
MAKSVIIQLTTAGTSTGPFNLLSNYDSYVTPFETNIAKTTLVTGYTSSLVPDTATIVRVLSSGSCTNHTDLTIVPTTTTSTTTTTTTTAPIPVNVTIQYDGSLWELYISQDFGAPPTLDALTFDGTVSGFPFSSCAGSSTVGPIVFSKMLPAGNTSAFTEIVASPPADWQTAKVTTMQVNGQVINSNYQNIVVGGHTYEIRGFLVCFPL